MADNIVTHPSVVLQALDAEAQAWATRTGLPEFAAQLSSDPRSQEKLVRFGKQCFAEGYHQGAIDAANGKTLQDSLQPAGAAMAEDPVDVWRRGEGKWLNEDDDAWDQDTGIPGGVLLGAAIQVWSCLQPGPTSVAAAAKAFNVAPIRVIQAVDDRLWMYLDGPRDDYDRLIIQHEGE